MLPSMASPFFAPSSEPVFDRAVPILHVTGLDNYAPVRPSPKLGSPVPLEQARRPPAPTPQGFPAPPGSGPNGPFAGSDFRRAYAPGVTMTGSGQVVGLLIYEGYADSDIKN
jgi:hypothetical protein